MARWATATVWSYVYDEVRWYSQKYTHTLLVTLLLRSGGMVMVAVFRRSRHVYVIQVFVHRVLCFGLFASADEIVILCSVDVRV